MEKQFYIYLLTTSNNKVLYTGVTNDLARRIYEHKQKMAKGFTKKYNVDKLVFYEAFGSIIDAIEREKQIKSWSRKKKNSLVDSMNPQWMDLYSGIRTP
jgi:putative endonuclease